MAGSWSRIPIAFSPNVDAGGALVSDPRPVLSYTGTPDASLYLRVLNDTVFSHGSRSDSCVDGAFVKRISSPRW